ncbi:hypothetical protein GALMADRAFT_148815 [Galerina marginata CBS 339.88]|uniref:Uncharacterized protein n=1 Tax=Galerina marginata (strain CBS 339.88) TaxID=685588 RepID=A0A067S367_GALM3|nr:hypothetical protein GALMADRAFT_148815 [Galerina marginata CBS 339.88]
MLPGIPPSPLLTFNHHHPPSLDRPSTPQEIFRDANEHEHARCHVATPLPT